MSETIVVTEGDEPNEAGETVLGEAAVAAAALSGAAAATAQQASGDAEDAEAAAEVANHVANTAVSIAASKPEMEDVEALIDARVSGMEDAILSRLEEMMSQQAAASEPVKEPVKDVMPASVDKKKKMSFAERYLGIKDGDE